ncbi:hypothetical protein [Flavobacterium sp.]|uniref:hypothetical protein n=1 Tax=Flavobacterium sp. TaxID=239 RepID=UPI00391A4427
MKFTIFKKSKKFHWTVEKIIYTIIFSSLALGYISEKVFDSEQNYVSKTCMAIALIGFFAGLVTKFIGFSQFEKLQGILDGYLVFKVDSIEIENREYNLNEIKRIVISNDDYSGKLVGTSRGHLGPALSNGTGNHIILFLNSRESKKVNFEMINSNDFQKVRNELINYHVNSKIDFWSLAHILGEKSTTEIAELTSEIEKFSTIANSRL